MGGFNLPPGCNVSDIPGNRPEDDAGEAFEEALCSRFQDVEKLLNSTSGVDQLLYKLFVTVADWALREGVAQGYADGKADAGINHEVEEAEKLAQTGVTMEKIRGGLLTLITINDTFWKVEIEGDPTFNAKATLRYQRDTIEYISALLAALEE